MKLKKTIGFIGCGNMGSAILAGLLKNRVVPPTDIIISDVFNKQVQAVQKKFRVQAAKNNFELARDADIIILGIKPQDLGMVTPLVRAAFALHSGKIVISILAGTPIAKLKKALGPKARLVRAMPNLGAQVGEAVTAITGTDRSALKYAEDIFGACGKVIRLDEKYFDVVTAVSGSGPAYFFLVMELLAKAATRAGLSPEAAQILAVQTAVGAGRLAQASKDSLGVLRQKVTSKKGTTEAALRFFHQKGFENILIGGVQKAIQRSRELSKK